MKHVQCCLTPTPAKQKKGRHAAPSETDHQPYEEGLGPNKR